jgi:hypothetical protein
VKIPAMIAERLGAQLLSGPPAGDPESVAARLLAIQAQDPRGARLAIRARSEVESVTEVDRALTDRRSLLISWLNRGTLHLVRSEDYPWLQALTTPQLRNANLRRLAQEGVTPAAAERGAGVIERSLEDEGPLSRLQLRERIARAGVRTEGQALVHLLMLACLRGIAVRGPMAGREHAYALVRDWLGVPPPVDRERALAELARRYLAGHGPADDRDLAKWAGVTLTDARAGLSAIASELEPAGVGRVTLAGRAITEELPAPRLLGAFDPVLMGWRSREQILASHEPLVVSGGLFRPIAIVRGRAVATWRIRAAEVVLEPFAALASEHAAALDADALEVTRYLATP